MEVLMPQLGETVAEGKVTNWCKAVGDTVKAGENLFEIETDKVSMEIQAIAGGVLSEIRVPVGEIAPVGAVVAVIGDGGEAGARPARAQARRERWARPFPCRGLRAARSHRGPRRGNRSSRRSGQDRCWRRAPRRPFRGSGQGALSGHAL